MATIAVNGCNEVATSKDEQHNGGDNNMVHCGNNVTQNHSDEIKGDNSKDSKSSFQKQDVPTLNHKVVEQLCDNTQTNNAAIKNVNGTNSEDSSNMDSYNKPVENDDKYSGFGIRPHNAEGEDDDDEDEMDSPPRMVFSLAGFAPLNDSKEEFNDSKEDLNDSIEESNDDSKQELDDSKEGLTGSKEESNDSKEESNDSKEELNEEEESKDSKAELNEKREESNNTKEELSEGREDLEEKKEDLVDKSGESNDSKEESNDSKEESNDSKEKLSDSKEEEKSIDSDKKSKEGEMDKEMDEIINEQEGDEEMEMDGEKDDSMDMETSEDTNTSKDKDNKTSESDKTEMVENIEEDNRFETEDGKNMDIDRSKNVEDSAKDTEMKDDIENKEKEESEGKEDCSKEDGNSKNKMDKSNEEVVESSDKICKDDENVNDDSQMDNEGCSDREDTRNGDNNDNVVILDDSDKDDDIKKNDKAKDEIVDVDDNSSEKLKGKGNEKSEVKTKNKETENDKSAAVEKVIIDGSEIVITINEDDESGEDSGKDADDESEDDDDDNKERQKKIHNKSSPAKARPLQSKNENNSADDLVVLDGEPAKESDKKDMPSQNKGSQRQIVLPSGAKTIITLPPGYVPPKSATGPQYILPTSSASNQYVKVIGQGQQAFYMPASSQYVINTTGANTSSLIAKPGQPVTLSMSSHGKSEASVDLTSSTNNSTSEQPKSVFSKEIDKDVPNSSWMMMELIKYETAAKRPDNTFWMGLANVNRKAEVSSVTKFLFDLGSDIVKESAYKQIISVQNKKLESGKLNPSETESLQKMKSVVKDLKEKVGHLDLKQKKCKGCGFQTSSKNAMVLHKEHPHMMPLCDVYGILHCAHCSFATKLPTAFTFHMNSEHNMTGRVYDKPAFYQCNLCHYENNNKQKLTSHKIKCAKNYKAHLNQAPYHFDINYCLKNIFYKFQIKQPNRKPETRTKALPPAKPPLIQPKQVRAPVIFPGQTPRPQGQGRFLLGPNQNVYRLNIPAQTTPFNQQFQQFALKSSQPQSAIQRTAVAQGQRPNIIRQNVPYVRPTIQPPTGKPTVGELLKQKQATVKSTVAPTASKVQARPSSTGQQQISQPAQNQGSSSGGFEVCEMCGGYVKDKMSLRIHFYYAHKIDMPANVFNRAVPPLHCEVCKKKFWTTQGLTKHKQSMKHNINAKPMLGQAMCWICHQKPDNLYSHLHKFHRLTTSECMTMKRCMFCGTLCTTRKELEIHMAAAHGVLIKGESQNTPNTPKPNVPTPASAGVASAGSPANAPRPTPGVSVSTRTVVTGSSGSKGPGLVRNNFCVFCAKQFNDNTQLTLHCLRDHATCSGCGMVVAKASDLKSHVCKVNKTSRNCELCGIKNLKSVYYTKHVTGHLKKCRVKLKRLKQGEIEKATKRKISTKIEEEMVEIISDSSSEDENSQTKTQKEVDAEIKISDDKSDKVVESSAEVKSEGNKIEGVNEHAQNEKSEKAEEKADVENKIEIEPASEGKDGAENSSEIDNEEVKAESVENEIKDNDEEKMDTSESKEDENEEDKVEPKEEPKDVKEEPEGKPKDMKEELKVEPKDVTEEPKDETTGTKRKSDSDDDKDENDDAPGKKRLRSADKEND